MVGLSLEFARHLAEALGLLLAIAGILRFAVEIVEFVGGAFQSIRGPRVGRLLIGAALTLAALIARGLALRLIGCLVLLLTLGLPLPLRLLLRGRLALRRAGFAGARICGLRLTLWRRLRLGVRLILILRLRLRLRLGAGLATWLILRRRRRIGLRLRR